MSSGSPAKPVSCRREAYFTFLDSLDILDTTGGLWDAAVAVSQHALDDLDVSEVREHLDEMADRASSRIRSDSFDARWTRLHEVMFDEEKFGGNVEHYYNPVNSYLPVVMQTHRGLPITLCLVYKALAHRMGLYVTGVNAPGHFLVRVHNEDQSVLIDPFSGGQILTTDEALKRIEQVVGAPCNPSCLREASHRDWLARLIRNLQHLFDCSHRMADLEAMNELAAALYHHQG